jgi:cytoskeletal protein CcmA (bactofilin family)
MIFGKRPPRATRRHMETEAASATAGPIDDDTGPVVIHTPPMKPFARPLPPTAITARYAPVAKPKPTQPIATPAAKPAIPNPRPADVVARPARQCNGPASRQSPGHTLVVGRDIRLTGEINACQRLVVEGTVEAELTDTRTLEIADTGHFRGSAVVGTCVVSGSFDGELTVSGLLAVRAGGRVGGAVRYAEIEIERGGRITGRADLQGPQEVRDDTPPAESRPHGGLGLRPA